MTTAMQTAITETINFATSALLPHDVTRIRRAVNSGEEIFAIDIETDTSGKPFKYPNGTDSLHPAGLDPRVGPVITVAIAGSRGTSFVFDSLTEESLLLDAVQAVFARFGRSIPSKPTVVGWNTTFFDVPFLQVRSRMCRNNLETTLRQNASNDYSPKYGFPEWVSELSRPEWNEAYIGDIPIIDLVPRFGQYATNNGLRHSLKPIAEHLGFNPVSVDATLVHELSSKERSEYCLSDAQVTVQLALWLAENAN